MSLCGTEASRAQSAARTGLVLYYSDPVETSDTRSPGFEEWGSRTHISWCQAAEEGAEVVAVRYHTDQAAPNAKYSYKNDSFDSLLFICHLDDLYSMARSNMS